MDQYSFSPEFQDSILALLLRDSSFCLDHRDTLNPVFFQNPRNVVIAQIGLAFSDRYGKTPGLTEILTEIDGYADQYRMDVEDREDLKTAAGVLYNRDLGNADYIREKAVEFAEHQQMKVAIRESAQIISEIEQGRYRTDGKPYERIRDTLQRALFLGEGAAHDLGFSLKRQMDQIPKLVASETLKHKVVPTGIHRLDNTMKGGLGRGEVGIIYGPPKRGKPGWVETPVLLGDGRRVRLGDVQVGDRVITGKGRARPVTAVHEQGDLDVLCIRTAGGREVFFAPDHPFLTAEGWKDAGDLEVGDRLAVVAVPETEGEEGTLAPDEVVSVEPAGTLPCRCLTVEEDATWTADDLVVHNSTVLVNFGAAAARFGHTVVHYTLELKRADIVLKYASRISGMSDVQLATMTVADIARFNEQMKQWFKREGSDLIVTYRSPGTVTAEWVRQHLLKLQSVHGLQPDLVILDFMDRLKYTDESLYRSGGDAMQKLVEIADQFQCGVWTASQAGRQSARKDKVTGDDIAESWRKIADCDIAISLNQDPEERANKELRLFISEQRRGESQVWVPCHIDYERSLLKERVFGAPAPTTTRVSSAWEQVPEDEKSAARALRGEG